MWNLPHISLHGLKLNKKKHYKGAKATNVYFQVLFDCAIEDSNSQQYHVALHNMRTGEKIYPRLPFNFENNYKNTVIAYMYVLFVYKN